MPGSVVSFAPNQCCAGSDAQARARSVIDCVGDRGRSLVGHVLVPGVVDVERGVGALVVVRRGHDDGEPPGLAARHERHHLPADPVGVVAEDHVQIAAHQHRDLVGAQVLDGHRGDAQVVVHPVGHRVAVADRDAPVVPLRYEHTRIDRVGPPREWLSEIVLPPVDEWEHRARCRADLQVDVRVDARGIGRGRRDRNQHAAQEHCGDPEDSSSRHRRRPTCRRPRSQTSSSR